MTEDDIFAEYERFEWKSPDGRLYVIHYDTGLNHDAIIDVYTTDETRMHTTSLPLALLAAFGVRVNATTTVY